MLGEPLDLKTIMIKTKNDWKNLIRGEVEYKSLGNDWVTLGLLIALIKPCVE